jgi:hypothetical protein
MSEREYALVENEENQNHFYLIFQKMAEADAEEEVLAQEIHEIEAASRAVQDVTDGDLPRFMTST